MYFSRVWPGVATLLFTIMIQPVVQAQTADRQYFGQTPPDSIPVMFAPGVISEAGYRLHGSAAFSPTGDEVFWPILPPALMHSELTDTGWTTPETLTFDLRGVGAPCFGPDGRRLYLHGAHPSGHGSLDIWYIERTDTGWSAPQLLPAPPNSESMESQPSIMRNGTLVFTGKLDSVAFERGIYWSRYTDASYEPPSLIAGINTGAIEYTPHVSADGATLLFSSSRPTVEESDLKLYAVFRTSDSTWSDPISVSALYGLKHAARFPMLSSDGRYLFYYAEGNVWWVSATRLMQKYRAMILQ